MRVVDDDNVPAWNIREDCGRREPPRHRARQADWSRTTPIRGLRIISAEKVSLAGLPAAGIDEQGAPRPNPIPSGENVRPTYSAVPAGRSGARRLPALLKASVLCGLRRWQPRRNAQKASGGSKRPVIDAANSLIEKIVRRTVHGCQPCRVYT